MPRGPVRARDLRANIAELGFDRGIVETLEHMLEEFGEHRQHMREMAELLSTCVNQVELMINTGDAMTRQIDQIKREVKGNENAGDQHT